MRREEYVDVDNRDVRAELKNDHPEWFLNSIFKRRDSNAGSLYTLLWRWDDDYEYENAYRLRSIRVGNEYRDDWTITCLVRGAVSRRIKEYFVSKMYNVNFVADGLPILGRFIFSRNPRDELVLQALAEEPVAWFYKTAKFRLAEFIYADLSRETFPSE
jgi:hypothetical protein